jgi:hypothetical protein
MDDDNIDKVVIGAMGSTDYNIPPVDLDPYVLNTLNNTMSYSYNTTANNIYSTIPAYGNVTISNSGSSSGLWTTSGYNGTSLSNSIEVTGEDADIVINGKSLAEFMTKMEDRLAILVPDPAKLEKFTALKKAYDHYKLMEKLCHEEPIENDGS